MGSYRDMTRQVQAFAGWGKGKASVFLLQWEARQFRSLFAVLEEGEPRVWGKWMYVAAKE